MKRFIISTVCIALIALFPVVAMSEDAEFPDTSRCEGWVLKGNAEQIVNFANNYFQMEWNETEITEHISSVREMFPLFEGEICDPKEYYSALFEVLGIPMTDEELQELINGIRDPRKIMVGDVVKPDFTTYENSVLSSQFIQANSINSINHPNDPLHGKVVITVVLLNTPGSYEWNLTATGIALANVDLAALWMMLNAPPAANLSVSKVVYGPVTVSGPANDRDYTGDDLAWMTDAAKQLGLGVNTVAELEHKIIDLNNADTAYTLFLLHEPGQPVYASVGDVRGTVVYYYFHELTDLGIWLPIPYFIYVHESLHRFGAKDEYIGSSGCTDVTSCDATSSSHSWDYQNSDCDACDSTSYIMNCGICNFLTASPSTRGMIGWGDHDNDGILDPDDYCRYTYGTGSTYRGCPEVTCNECEIPFCDDQILGRYCHLNSDCYNLALNGPVCEDICTTFYQDGDGDLYGNLNVIERSITQPDGYVINADDCNDADASINPDAVEVCNGVDDNCNSSIDEGVPSFAMTCGIGDCLADGVHECNNGQMVDNCMPGEPSGEICDGLDNDCDGESDEYGYDFSNFYPPLQEGGSSTFKAGRTVPVKVSLADCDGQTVEADSLSIILEAFTNGSAAAMPVQSSGKSNSSRLFRYDAESEQYIYNLKTKGLAAGKYQVTAVTENGVSQSAGLSLH